MFYSQQKEELSLESYMNGYSLVFIYSQHKKTNDIMAILEESDKVMTFSQFVYSPN